MGNKPRPPAPSPPPRASPPPPSSSSAGTSTSGAATDLVQTLPLVNWQTVVSQLTENAPEDTISGLAAVVALAITHRPQGVTSFVKHGGLGALARLVISTRCLAANRRTCLVLIALLLRETPSLLPMLTEHTPMTTLIDAIMRSGVSELQATGLAMLQELSIKTPALVTLSMVQLLHGHLQTLQRNADPFGSLCQLLLVWGADSAVMSAVCSRSNATQALLQQFIQHHKTGVDVWAAFALWQRILTWSSRRTGGDDVDVEEMMERAIAVDPQWWSLCAELAKDSIASLRSGPSQEREMWLARLNQVSSILLLTLSLDQERLRPHWMGLFECWLRALALQSLSPADTKPLALCLGALWSRLSGEQRVSLLGSNGLSELWQYEMTSTSELDASVLVQSLLSFLKCEGDQPEMVARHIVSFLQQSAPLLRRTHLPMPALIYSLALSCEQYRPVVIPILMANIEHLPEPKQESILRSLFSMLDTLSDALKGRVLSAIERPDLRQQCLTALVQVMIAEVCSLGEELLEVLVLAYTTCGLADHRRLIATALGARCNSGVSAERSKLLSLFGPHMVTVAQDLSSPLLSPNSLEQVHRLCQLLLITKLAEFGTSDESDTVRSGIASMFLEKDVVSYLVGLPHPTQLSSVADLVLRLTTLPEEFAQSIRRALADGQILRWLESVLSSYDVIPEITSSEDSQRVVTVVHVIHAIWPLVTGGHVPAECYTSSLVKALLKHSDTCHASRLVMGVLSNMCAYAPLELVRLMSNEEQWSRCFNLSGPVVAGLERKDLFLVIEANLTLVRRKITTATPAIQEVERAVAAFCARTSWSEENLELSWSAADLRDTVLVMLAGPGAYHQLWALWTLNYIVHQPELDKAPIGTNWPQMISHAVHLTGHRYGPNATLAASLLLAMQPAWSLIDSPELVALIKELLLPNNSALIGHSSGLAGAELPLLLPSSSTSSSGPGPLSLISLQPAAQPLGLQPGAGGSSLTTPGKCQLCGQPLLPSLVGLLGAGPVHCGACAKISSAMSEAASHRAAGSFAKAITCYTDLLSATSDHEEASTNISIELAKTRLLAGLQLVDHTLIAASLSALQTLPQSNQQEVRLLRGLAELLAGQFVNGLQGLKVVAGHSSAKQAKLLRKVMTLAVSVLNTGTSLEPELLDKLQQFL